MRTILIFTLFLVVPYFLSAQIQPWYIGDSQPDQTSFQSEAPADDEIIVKRIFPTPASDILNVELAGVPKTVQYEIFTINGKMVERGIMVRGQIQVDRLARSTYVLRLFDENKRYAGAWKFMKK